MAALCTGVIDFAVTCTLSGCLLVFKLFGGDLYIDLHHQLFAFVTHLGIFDIFGDREAHIFPHLPVLPALPHLCLNEAPWSVVEKMLTDCAKIELLVLLWPYRSASQGFEWMDKFPFCDVRPVGALYNDYWEDWENGARGLGNFWSAADTFVARKRLGGIDGTRLASLVRQS
ncbi:hypothetical protein B0H11DRAFT_2242817 [Mycena galericulata]|nr:hypothetical protein B0H11DRAFT_2242817 [Mycena galericulata]